MEYAELTGNWNYPNAIKAGAGSVAVLPQLCRDRGISKPLLVTDPGVSALAMTASILESLAEAGLSAELFDAIRLNPSGANVEAGVEDYRKGGCDGVIALGGGSGLDVGKAVALMAAQRLPIWEFEDVGDNWTKADPEGIAPVIAIPTTAGTGSEVGRASVITDEAQQVKKIIFHPLMLPKAVVLDPELTVGLSAKLTAATGMDALSHNLEALCSPFYHPMAEGIAVEGCRLVQRYLPRATAQGDDLEARMQMLVASAMGATAFQKGLGGMHALAHSLGALYDAHHGLLNAILMPYVLKRNQSAIEERICRLARYLDLGDDSFEAFLQWVLDLRRELGIPHDLTPVGVCSEDLERIGQMSERDPSAAGNPIALDAREYAELCAKALAGDH